MRKYDVIIIGAGPAGLSAAYQLAKAEKSVLLLEKDPISVGGLSRTVSHQGYYFDIGGHRFFTKEKRVQNFWHEILPNHFFPSTRLSRIYYQKKFFYYPLRLWDTLSKVGLRESLGFVLSFLRSKCQVKGQNQTFEDWAQRRFGFKLYQKFFRSYTEKVWGRPCHQISKDWAAQRIQNFSLGHAIISTLFKFTRKKFRTLQESFYYPQYGPGMMWQECAKKSIALGAELKMGATLSRCQFDNHWQVTFSAQQQEYLVQSEHLISTIPIPQIINLLSLSPQGRISQQASQFSFRSMVMVAVMFRDNDQSFPDNWIYIHEPHLQVSRIQNFKRWSKDMVPSSEMACLGMEYFCDENDHFWKTSDDELVQLAWRELKQLGFIKREDLCNSKIIRVPKAYPVYDLGYKKRLEEIIDYLKHHYPKLHLSGRNGMHRYNNQDHSILTSMMITNTIIKQNQDQTFEHWKINSQPQYIEDPAFGHK